MSIHTRIKSFVVWAIPGGVGAFIAVLPWLRNHGYLRDLYDYGLVMAGVGRIGNGESPYVDFITPIQSGVFLLNLATERVAGATYLGMTTGNAVLIVGSTLLLTWILARRWSPLISAMTATAVVVAGAGQHTIIWHNSIGVVCLAVAAWMSALSPVLSRSTWTHHLLIGGALFLGGINKLNFHLIAVAVVVAWALRAALTDRASWRRTGLTLIFTVVCGALLPVFFELGWTGASFSQWWYNVVSLSAGGRLQILKSALSLDFYLQPPHDYYGPILIPAAGLIGLIILTMAVLAAANSATVRGSKIERWLLAGATVVAAAGGIALLATNYEIASVGMAASLVLAVGLWLGFGEPLRRGALYPGAAAAAIVVATAGWHDAWAGIRSQFGHSPHKRDHYRQAESFHPEFQYLRGLMIPPDIGHSLGMVMAKLERQGMDPGRLFPGPGLEFLIREIPVKPPAGLPLWMHLGTSYGLMESLRLATALSPGGPFRSIAIPEAWDIWHDIPKTTLTLDYVGSDAGPAIHWYDLSPFYDRTNDPFSLARNFGMNTHRKHLTFEGQPFSTLPLEDDTIFLGIREGTAAIRLNVRSFRVSGEAILRRLGGDTGMEGFAHFQVDIDIDGHPLGRWSETIKLQPGETETVVPFLIDSSGRPVVMRVTLPPGQDPFLIAGWRGPSIRHSGQEAPGRAPVLRETEFPDTVLEPNEVRRLFREAWQPEHVVIRGGVFTARGLELLPGGELWVRTGDIEAEFSGSTYYSSGESPERLVLLRSVWYDGGRLEIASWDSVGSAEKPGQFHSWTTEPGGWMGVLVDPVDVQGAIILDIHDARVKR